MIKNLAIFVLGAAAVLVCAVGAWLGWEQLKSVAPDRLVYASASTRAGADPICRGSVLNVARPAGVVTTPAQAEMVFRSTFPDKRLRRTRVRVSDRGDVWLVEQTRPADWKGAGYTVQISKCDATVTLLQLPED
jgi:hypothetical protein